MALQIHKNLSPVDGIWGNATASAYPLVNRSTTDTVTVRILQGAFLCKGYNPGPFDGTFGNSTANAIKEFKENLGMPGDEELTAEYFKSLLSTDPTVLVGTGNVKIRAVQQYLNGNYYSLYKSNLGFLPTGGVYDRKTSKALIYAIQKEIGSTPDGLLGPATFGALPTVKTGYTNAKVIKILQAALVCHNYDVEFNGIYEALMAGKIEEFQKFMCLNLDPAVVLGEVNRRTWGALLWSKGDTERKPNACDCTYRIIEQELADALYEQGFRYIGRYLTNVDPNNEEGKKLSIEEIDILLNAGLKIFPIFQESPNIKIFPSDFYFERGQSDGEKAITAALKLGVPKGTIIYFALDCDMTETDLMNFGIPYFQGINNVFSDSLHYFKIGVYGTRNACIMLANQGYTISSFVSNMSTSYSGNLGFPMPNNWAFEQYIEKKGYSLENYTFDLDYDMASGRDEGFSNKDCSIDVEAYIPPYRPTEEQISNIKSITDLIDGIKQLEDIYYTVKEITNPNAEQKVNCALAVLDYLYQYQYKEYPWDFISPRDEEFVSDVNTKFNVDDVNALYSYIYATEEGEGNNKLTTRAKVVTDGCLGILEIPHLAVVIKCYIKSLVPGSWSAWAGDFASAVKETYVNAGVNGGSEKFLEIAKTRIGAMEADTVNIIEARLFNYCDLIADIDGYAIYQLMQESTSTYMLSECIKTYYSDSQRFYKRYQYFQEMIGFENWGIIEIKEAILRHFSLVLKIRFAAEADEYPEADDMTAVALALNII